MSSAPGRASFRAACSNAWRSPPSSPMAGDVLLLDEPFGALDYVTRHQLQDVLLDLWEEPGRAVPTVVFVTHDVDEALTLADRIVAMRSGAIVDDIPVAPRVRATPTACFCRRWSRSSTRCLAISASPMRRARRSAREERRDRPRSQARLVSCPSVFLALIVLWEILSFVYTVEAQPGEPMVAGWGTLFTRTLLEPLRLLAGRIRRAPSRTALRAAISPRCSRSCRIPLATLVRLCERAPARRRSRPRSRPCRFLVAVEPQACSSSRRSFCALCRCSRWCRCSSSGSAPISSARCCSSRTASA